MENTKALSVNKSVCNELNWQEMIVNIIIVQLEEVETAARKWKPFELEWTGKERIELVLSQSHMIRCMYSCFRTRRHYPGPKAWWGLSLISLTAELVLTQFIFKDVLSKLVFDDHFFHFVYMSEDGSRCKSQGSRFSLHVWSCAWTSQVSTCHETAV